ncbi:hypothetical protein IFO69_07065 [Echinicola sp. CAU 1574]|uniref:Uncharacterized protein n=1 Tax=Echinicola arenosa TaxID=2774144 RepID=A0ABR9AI34_9BACT|nr:hypothetical protein [Echinicola arenosa]MBD8488502.1 hypothetical protein [Echinicola arenosa]
MMKRFDEIRSVFKPYGFSCEMWMPNLMHRPDRHNEIEINFFPEEGIAYLFKGRKIKILPNRITLFWALTPHQIIVLREQTALFRLHHSLFDFFGMETIGKLR